MGGGLATRDVFSFSVEGAASASMSAALTTAFRGDWMDSLRNRPGIEDLDTGEWRTSGLSISVGTAEREDVCKFFKVDFRV